MAGKGEKSSHLKKGFNYVRHAAKFGLGPSTARTHSPDAHSASQDADKDALESTVEVYLAPENTRPPEHHRLNVYNDEPQSTAGAVSSQYTTDSDLPPKASLPPRTGTNRGRPYTKFRDELSLKMKDHKIGLRDDVYFPHELWSTFISAPRIKEIFSGVAEDLVAYITTHLPNTFLITILSMQDDRRGVEALEAFQRHKFTDHELPVQRPESLSVDRIMDDAVDCVACAEMMSHEEAAMKPLGAFNHDCWDDATLNDFCTKQWQFCLQIFDVGTFQYKDIEDERILPILQASDPADHPSRRKSMQHSGAFSEVKQVSMLASHLAQLENLTFGSASSLPVRKALEPDEKGHIKVALKTLKHVDEGGYVIEKEWQRETDALKTLNGLGNDHIVKGLAAFRQRKVYYLLLEWANGGTLRSFWNSKKRPVLTATTIRGLLEQLRALAGALNHMHNKPRSRRSSNHSQEEAETTRTAVLDFQKVQAANRTASLRRVQEWSDAVDFPSITIDDTDDVELAQVPTIEISNIDDASEILADDVSTVSTNGENWRHGDIKPENILRFIERDQDIDDVQDIGILKLADLGRAKKHVDPTHIRSDLEIDNWHTRNYEPPDIHVNSSRTTSRLYDIWSLGCVFFDFVIWILYGKEGIKDFENTSFEHARKGSFFWQRSGNLGGGANVSQMAALWMDYILEKDPDCKHPSAIRDLMLLVRDKMLVVDLPARSDRYETGRRASAQVVVGELDRILLRATTDAHYLFAGADRRGFDPPPGPQVVRMLGIKSTAKAAAPSAIANPANGGPVFPAISGLLLPTPAIQSSGTTAARQRNQYTHALSSAWFYIDDDDFAKQTLGRVFNDQDFTSSLYCQPSELCKKCSTFDAFNPTSFMERRGKELIGPSRKCTLCKLVLDLLKSKFDINNPASDEYKSAPVKLTRRGQILCINDRPDMVLRIGRSPGTSSVSLGLSEPETHVPIGMPKVPARAGDVHSGLLREWLKDCDNHGCIPTGGPTYCPRRLIYIGKDEDGNDCCKLVETSELKNKGAGLRYVALSHPWGDPEVYEHFKSTKANIKQHMEGMNEPDLPQNFLDAIEIARGLKCAYLWTDSICIRQASGNDTGDFREEAGRMQDIFTSAYCSIAASSAEGMDDGFLDSKKDATVVIMPPKVGQSETYQCYLSNVVDDFAHDVEQGPLSGRGWVFQERALARRTIYFTKNQTYFECGYGIRCETLSTINSNNAAFLGDSNFPQFGTKGQPMGAQLFLFMGLYEHYSRLLFTQPSDKPKAVAGLEQRLTQKFADRSGAGVFASHSCRWLLWERAEGVEALEQIEFPSDDLKSPPSWSWMSYIGQISYLVPPHRRTDWNRDIELILTGNERTSWLYTNETLAMRAPVLTVNEDDVYQIADGFNSLSATSDRSVRTTSLVLDRPRQENGSIRHFVIIGTWGNSRAYVLIVIPSKGKKHFQRVGAGWIPYKMLQTGSISAEPCTIV